MTGKLRAQRAKSMKFKDGYMISSGQPVNEYIDSAVRHVLLRQVGLPPFVSLTALLLYGAPSPSPVNFLLILFFITFEHITILFG